MSLHDHMISARPARPIPRPGPTMRSDAHDRRADVVIVGGGFSGTMLAAELARRGLRVDPDRGQRPRRARHGLFDAAKTRISSTCPRRG